MIAVSFLVCDRLTSYSAGFLADDFHLLMRLFDGSTCLHPDEFLSSIQANDQSPTPIPRAGLCAVYTKPTKNKRQRRRCPKKPSELPIARITTNIHHPLDNNRSLRIIARSITITIPRTRFHKSLRLPRARRDPSGAGGARSAVLAVPGVTNARSGSGGSVFAASGAAEGCYVFGSC
jgi:hypothetical protein